MSKIFRAIGGLFVRNNKVSWCIACTGLLYFIISFFYCSVFGSQNVSHRLKLSGSFADKRLYEETVIVNSYSNNERKSVIASVFKKILVRVTGHVDILENEDVKSATANPDNYLRKYSYEGGEQQAGTKPSLKLTFDQVSVDNLIKKTNFPILGGKRTNVLVVIAIDKQGDRYMINREGREEGADEIMKAFQARAIPAFFPLWDIADQSIKVGDVLGGVEDGLNELANRYYAKSFVVGKILALKKDNMQLYRGKLTYEFREKKYTRELEDVTFEELKLGIVNLVSETLSSDHIIQTADNEKSKTIMVVVNGMNALNKWDYLERRIKSISGVKDFKIKKLSKAHLEVKVNFSGDLKTFQDSMLADKKMKAILNKNILEQGKEGSVDLVDRYLHYNWYNEK